MCRHFKVNHLQMFKMFSTTAFLYATLVPIFSHPYPIMIPESHTMMHPSLQTMSPMSFHVQSTPLMMPQQNIPQIMPQQSIHPMMSQQNVNQMMPNQNIYPVMPQQNIHPMMSQQNIHPMISGNQINSPMFSEPLMSPPQQMAQDFQSPSPDYSVQQQLLLLIMSAYSRLVAYIQLLTNNIKMTQYNSFNDSTGTNMNPNPVPMSNNIQPPIEAQQAYQNQLLIQQQQAAYHQQLIDEEQQLLEEGKKQEKTEKLELEKENLKPVDSNYSKDMYIGTAFLPHIYAIPTKYNVFQTLPVNIGSFYNKQNVDENIEQQNRKPQQLQQFLQSNNQKLDKELRYADQNLNQQHQNPMKIYRSNLETQTPPMPDDHPHTFKKGMQYQNYLLMKLGEKKQQFKQKKKKDLKQPWKNPKDHSKFLQRLYIDHLLHEEYDHEEHKNNSSKPRIKV